MWISGCQRKRVSESRPDDSGDRDGPNNTRPPRSIGCFPPASRMSISECAVDAFARTFLPSHPKYTKTVTPPRRPNMVEYLPVELLAIIFGLVYDQEIQQPSDSDPDSYPEWHEADIMSPSLFPYAIASVCSFWRDVASLIPDFWTRVVISIDRPTPSQSAAIAFQLLWSRDLPLDVTISRRTFDRSVFDINHEKILILSITKTMIHPHIHRLRKLRINTIFNSSLPSFPKDFLGATILTSLALECIHDRDDRISPRFLPVEIFEPEYEYPALKTLEIDGGNYFNTFTRGIAWEFVAKELHELSISRFHTSPCVSLLTPYEFISQLAFLKNLTSLRISDVRLLRSSNRYTQQTWLDNLTYLELSDLSDPQIVDEVFDYIPDGIEVKLLRCAIGAMGLFGDSGELTLEEISPDQDLVKLLTAWRGYDLHVSNCPGFDARVLDRMHKKRSHEYICAPNARYLGIVDCPNISVTALQRLVAARLDGPDTGQFEMVCVSGRAPTLSSKDRRWFTQNIPDFYYPRVLAE